MEIILNKIYKSLHPFVSDELPNFTVIIGKNGTGKTHLLEQFLFKGGGSLNNTHGPLVLEIQPDTQRILQENFNHISQFVIAPYDYLNKIETLHSTYTQILQREYFKKIWLALSTDQSIISQVYHYSIINENSAQAYLRLLNIEPEKFAQKIAVKNNLVARQLKVDSFLVDECKQLKNLIASSYPEFELCNSVAKQRNKSILELQQSDFLLSAIDESYFTPATIVEPDLSKIFYNFCRRRHFNRITYYDKSEFNINYQSISPSQFASTNQAPWEVLNETFREAGFPFEVPVVHETDFHPDSRFTVHMYKIGEQTPIEVSKLSTGEKIIMHLLSKVFVYKYFSRKLNNPDIIIADEPDANLHPEYVHKLISIINDVLVEKLKIKFILTSHSPTTVAVAPEGSVFRLTNGPNTSLKQISKDEALKDLTLGIPNLSIDYKNHRQVFVESETDLLYYQTLYNEYKTNNQRPHELYFIAAGMGNSNCTEVIDLNQKLHAAGNKNIRGIIDWDEKNTDKESVFVHGSKSRYTLENFLFDPIYLYALLHENTQSNIIQHANDNHIVNQYNILSEGKGQIVVDFICATLKSKMLQIPLNEEPVEVTYGSKITLKIPHWYLIIPGHDLELKLKEVFQKLEGISRRGKNVLPELLTNQILKTWPNFPKDTLDLFDKLTA